MQDADWQCVLRAGDALGLNITASQRNTFELYIGLLQRWQVVAGLTAVRDESEIVIKHFIDSLHVAAVLTSGILADIGSGGGFPGGPLAVCVPGLKVVFVEKESRKCRFLETLCTKLHLSAQVIQGRSEEISERENRRYPTVAARALASPQAALAICHPLMEPAGRILLQVGPSALEQLDYLRKEGNSRRLILENMISYELPRSMGKRALLVFRSQGVSE